jgi:hypothetical protein
MVSLLLLWRQCGTIREITVYRSGGRPSRLANGLSSLLWRPCSIIRETTYSSCQHTSVRRNPFEASKRYFSVVVVAVRYYTRDNVHLLPSVYRSGGTPSRLANRLSSSLWRRCGTIRETAYTCCQQTPVRWTLFEASKQSFLAVVAALRFNTRDNVHLLPTDIGQVDAL